MKSEHIESPIEEKPVTTTSQETKKQSQDSFVKVFEVMEKANKLQEAGISAATYSQDEALSEEKPYPMTVTSQDTNRQLQDCLAKFSKVMEEANEILKAGISSAIYSCDKGISSEDQSFQGWMGIMTAEDVEVLNGEENRDFYLAVSSGNVKKAQFMLEKNSGLAKIKIQNGMLPIHMAASCGHKQMLRFLYDKTKPDDLEREQRVQLFFTTIKNNKYDVAIKMLKTYKDLAHSRYKELTALHVLAGKQSEDKFKSRLLEENLIHQLYRSARKMERNKMLEFISKPSGVLFDAAKSGNFLILETFLESNPELLMVLDSKRRSLLHTAVLHRQASPFFDMIKHYGMWKDLAMQVVDDDGNNILHMAGMVLPHERFESSRPDIQMQGELLWFKEVEEIVPAAFKSMRNKEGQTPEDVFYRTHRKLMISAELAMKDKANYGMLVATIIATIVFAASLTVPGHDVSPEANSSILQENGWYIIFILSDEVALFSSSSSIIIFLTVLTSSYTEDEFNISLLRRLTFGVAALLVAITTMVVASIAACFLIFNHHSTWVAYVVASLGFLTVALFVFLLYPLFRDLIAFMYSSKAYLHHSRLTKSDQRLKSHDSFVGLMKGLAFKIRYYLLKMCQNVKAKLCFQEDNPMDEP